MFKPYEKPDAEVKALTPDLDGLIAWLKTQDPQTTYDWGDIWGCVINNFLTAIGKRKKSDENSMRLDEVFKDEGDYGFVGCGNKYFQPDFTGSQATTYGGALERAEFLKAQKA